MEVISVPNLALTDILTHVSAGYTRVPGGSRTKRKSSHRPDGQRAGGPHLSAREVLLRNPHVMMHSLNPKAADEWKCGAKIQSVAKALQVQLQPDLVLFPFHIAQVACPFRG